LQKNNEVVLSLDSTRYCKHTHTENDPSTPRGRCRLAAGSWRNRPSLIPNMPPSGHPICRVARRRCRFPASAIGDQLAAPPLKPGTHYPCSRPVFVGREHGPWAGVSKMTRLTIFEHGRLFSQVRL